MLIRNYPPPRTTIGPWAWSYCRILMGGSFLRASYPCRSTLLPFSSILSPCETLTPTTRWITDLSSKVNYPHGINFQGLVWYTLGHVTPFILGEPSLRSPLCGTSRSVETAGPTRFFLIWRLPLTNFRPYFINAKPAPITPDHSAAVNPEP